MNLLRNSRIASAHWNWKLAVFAFRRRDFRNALHFAANSAKWLVKAAR